MPIGICIVEIDEVIDEGSANQVLDLVITETGKKPAIGKVQSLWVAAIPEEFEDDIENANLGNGEVWTEGLIRIASRTLTGASTGVAANFIPFARFPTVPTPISLLNNGHLAFDLVAIGSGSDSNLFVPSNGFLIPSQGLAGQISLRFGFESDSIKPYDFHAIAAIESPVGNLCSLNLVPVRDVDFLDGMEE